MNNFIHKTVWRSGVVLKSGGNTALVKADTEDRKIFISVNGAESTRRDFLSAIRAQFEVIHKTITKIEAREKVPVPTHPLIAVDYEHLLKLERKGVNEFIPEGLDDPVSVKHLLDGVAAPEVRQRILIDDHRIEHEPVPASLIVPAEKKSLSRVSTHTFAGLPRVIGRTITDLFGRDKAASSTAIILGYVVIVLVILLIWGAVDLSALKKKIKCLAIFFP